MRDKEKHTFKNTGKNTIIIYRASKLIAQKSVGTLLASQQENSIRFQCYDWLIFQIKSREPTPQPTHMA